jgi:hypothetical protein
MPLAIPDWASHLWLGSVTAGHIRRVWVSNFPPPDATEIIALRIALAALVVVIVTLGAVGYQIKIARDELKYVKLDLENNNKQMAEFSKRPKLRPRRCGDRASKVTGHSRLRYTVHQLRA